MNFIVLTLGGMHLPGKKATLRKYLEVCTYVFALATMQHKQAWQGLLFYKVAVVCK
jgi:hypothetical protein